MPKKIKGLIAAPFTAFTGNGQLRLDRVSFQAEVLKAQGISGVFVGGTTGEGESLTAEERMDLAESWVEHASETFKVIVHVGHASAKQGALLAEHAQKIGADAVGAIYLHHFIPPSVREVVAFCQEIAAGAADLPFYYYHMPAQTGLPFKASDILLAASGLIPNLVGCKFTYEDLLDYQRCLELDGGRFDVLFGRDEMLLASLAFGAEGWIGSTFNLAGLIHHQIIKAYREGDMHTARRCQREVNELIGILADRGYMKAAKAAFGLYGADLGPLRAPLSSLTDAEVEQLHGQLDRFDLRARVESASLA